MKLHLTLEPTERFFETDVGIPGRAWTGHTNRGTPVTAFIAALASARAARVPLPIRQICGQITFEKLSMVGNLQV
jgi:hypothetical protein